MTSNRGGRPATGSIKWRAGQWWARVTLPNGSRPWVDLDPNILRDDVAGAKACAAQVSADARNPEAPRVKARVKETVGEFAGRWLADREGRVKSLRSDRARLRDHVLSLIGTDDVRAIGRERIELVRDDLDRKIARAELSWKTAANVWTCVTSLFDDAVNAKRRELRVREDNPCRDVKPPDRGAKKQKQFLWPSEAVQLFECRRVPLRWRRAVAVAIYTFARDGELRALEWSDVDLAHGTISITRAYNQNTKRVEQTKTGDTRRFTIEPALLPLLEAMHREAGGKGHVLSLAPQGNMARKLRLYLKRAGVTRPELLEASPTRKPMTAHDLRATGLTWLAVRGDEPLRIMQRAGHASFGTTQGYIRTAEAIRQGFGEPFPPLPACLLSGPGVSSRVSVLPRSGSRDAEKTAAAQYRRRDSNPTEEPIPEPGKDAGSSMPPDVAGDESAPGSRPLAAGSHPSERPEPKPEASERPSVAVLRAKLDAAIVAEAWHAVKAIRERIAEAERDEADASGKVVSLDARRR